MSYQNTSYRDEPQQPSTGATGRPNFTQPSHDFTLQAVMELQKSVGSLESEVKGLRESQTTSLNKVDKVCDKLDGIDKKLYTAGIIGLIVIAVAGWVVNAAYDLSKDAIKAAIIQQMSDEKANNNKNEPN